ncbi:MAG: phosphoglycerate dehydrogenase [Alphaproteobacteria bacterium]|nr:phosphoglycerate dehydrogenase [Alphaproteobacteria bacterium]
MPKVLIADKMDAVCAEILKAKGLEVESKPGLTPEELKGVISNYDGVAVRSSTKISAEVMTGAKALKVIGRAGIGVDTIDVPAATNAGIVVMNTPFGNSTTTAEHTIALMMSLARQIPQASASTHAGKWEKTKFMGVELMGKTLGVIGCGNIGAIVIDRAQGLKMRVIGYDPFLTDERARAMGIEKVELDELFTRSDFITVHTPMTEKTKGIINKDAFAKMKNGVRILNVARGGLIVEEDLKAALESGKVAGAALDVFAVEPAKESIFFGMENVICTPHLGASTSEAQVNVAVQIAEQIADFLLHGAVSNAVNMPSISAEDAPKLKPYMKLVEQMGRLAGQINADAITGIEIVYQGQAAALNVKPLNAIALASILAVTCEGVNMVSAPAMAKARGINITESKTDNAGDFLTAVTIKVHTDKGAQEVTGTLFGGGHPRIVSVDGVPIEAALTPNMLLIRNKDKPGMIGGVGSILAEAGVNIADFRLGRMEAGGHAISLIAVDQKVDDKTYAKLKALPAAEDIVRLSF